MWLTCLFCGQTFYGVGKFCTSKCEGYFINPPLPVKPVGKKCLWCGKQCAKAYCSKECKRENSRNGTVTCLCEFCGKSFMGSYAIKYCSDECRVAGVRRKAELRSRDKCIQCGGPMPDDYVGTCSKECQIAFNAKETP